MTLEMIKKEEFEEGMEIGLQEGRQEEKRTTALKMLEKGKLTIEEIAEYCEMSIVEIERLAQM